MSGGRRAGRVRGRGCGWYHLGEARAGGGGDLRAELGGVLGAQVEDVAHLDPLAAHQLAPASILRARIVLLRQDEVAYRRGAALRPNAQGLVDEEGGWVAMRHQPPGLLGVVDRSSGDVVDIERRAGGDCLAHEMGLDLEWIRLPPFRQEHHPLARVQLALLGGLRLRFLGSLVLGGGPGHLSAHQMNVIGKLLHVLVLPMRNT